MAFSNGIFRYRQNNPEAITKKVTAKSSEYCLTQFQIYKLVLENGFTSENIQAAALSVVKTYQHYKKLHYMQKSLFSDEELITSTKNLSDCYTLMANDITFSKVIHLI